MATLFTGIKAYSHSRSRGWSSRLLFQSLVWKSPGSFRINDTFPCYFDSFFCHESWLTILNLFLLNQDTLASAVAEEMQKVYKKELGPEPVPLTVPGEAIAEEDVSLIIFIYIIIGVKNVCYIYYAL